MSGTCVEVEARGVADHSGARDSPAIRYYHIVNLCYRRPTSDVQSMGESAEVYLK
jgi:hypothetical protein